MTVFFNHMIRLSPTLCEALVKYRVGPYEDGETDCVSDHCVLEISENEMYAYPDYKGEPIGTFPMTKIAMIDTSPSDVESMYDVVKALCRTFEVPFSHSDYSITYYRIEE